MRKLSIAGFMALLGLLKGPYSKDLFRGHKSRTVQLVSGKQRRNYILSMQGRGNAKGR